MVALHENEAFYIKIKVKSELWHKLQICVGDEHKKRCNFIFKNQFKNHFTIIIIISFYYT